MNQYKERDLIGLDKVGNYYIKHVAALTREDLRSKSGIAAELGYRDMIIDKLVNSLSNLIDIVENRPDSHYLEVHQRSEFEDAKKLLSETKQN